MLTDPALARHRAFLLWHFEANPRPERKPLKVPLHPDGHTRHNRWNPAPGLDPESAAALSAALGVGVGFRPEDSMGIACLDLDGCVNEDGEWSQDALAWAALFQGAAIEVTASGRGLHIWFTYTGPAPGKRPKVVTPMGDVELYSSGQFIAFGTYHSGSASTDCTEAMRWLLDTFYPARSQAAEAVVPSDWASKSPAEQERTIADLRAALATLDPSTYQEWVSTGNNLSSLGDVGFQLWREWSLGWPGASEAEIEWKWSSLSADRSDYRSIFKRAEAAGWVNSGRSSFDPAVAFTKPELPPGAVVVVAAPPATDDLSLMEAAAGTLQANISTLAMIVRKHNDTLGLAYDTFRGTIVLKHQDRPVVDEDYIAMIERLENGGFKSIKVDTMKNVVRLVARENIHDSLTDHVEALEWDGVSRVETFFPRLFGVADTPYTRAVGLYLFTSLAGRALIPGLECHMVPILVGGQGAAKSSCIRALQPFPDTFAELDMSRPEDDLARRIKGKVICELAEMKGLSNRDREHIKAWVVRSTEEWVEKYRESTTSYRRRCLFIGTANENELLDDPTGERRWLPMVVGEVNERAVRNECLQLWAEGKHLFRQMGQQWEPAMRLARDEHHAFKVIDELQDAVSDWLEAVPPHIPGTPVRTTRNGDEPFRMVDLLTHGLRIDNARTDRSMQMRVAKILRALGYSKREFTIGGKSKSRWFRK